MKTFLNICQRLEVIKYSLNSFDKTSNYILVQFDLTRSICETGHRAPQSIQPNSSIPTFFNQY